MPNRILKESINESKGLSETSPFTQDLYKRLITYADDYGRFNADPEIMRARLYPRELDAVTEADILESLVDLIGVGKFRLYTNPVRDHMVFGYFPRWTEHQRIRNTRAKCPEPASEEVNDWALRRFIPIALKIKIFQRDKFTCQECGHSYELPGMPTKQAIRLLSGALHIDHIVPVIQGGRATEENLRLLCASCNQSRPKQPTLDEITAVAADCSESPPVAAERRLIQSNPIQSESNPNPIHVAAEAAKQTEPPEKQARHRATTVNDAIVDGLCAILGTPQTDKRWTNYRKVAGQLLRATPPVEPSEMPYIGQQWDRVFRGMTPSEDAIVKWLHKLRPNGNGKSPPLSLVPERYCPLCGELPDETHCHCDLGELRKAKDASIAAGRDDYAVTMAELLAIRRAGNLFEWLALQATGGEKVCQT